MKKILLSICILLFSVSICFGETIGLLRENTVIFYGAADVASLPEVKLKNGDDIKYKENLIQEGKAIRIKGIAKVYIMEKSIYNGIIYYKVATTDRRVEGWVRIYDLTFKGE